MTETTTESAAESPPEAQKALWARSVGTGFPRTVKVLAAVAAVSAAWCIVELARPEAHVPELDMPAVVAGTENPGAAQAAQEPSFSPLVFSARKLFIPVVPVESQETSRAVVEEMLSRLRLTGVLEQNGQLVAWIEVSGADRESGTRRPGASPRVAASSSRIERIVKGDHVLDFEVMEITQDSVMLKVAGFEATLAF